MEGGGYNSLSRRLDEHTDELRGSSMRHTPYICSSALAINGTLLITCVIRDKTKCRNARKGHRSAGLRTCTVLHLWWYFPFLTRMTKVVIPWSSFISRLTWSKMLRPAARENSDIGARTPFTVLVCRALGIGRRNANHEEHDGIVCVVFRTGRRL